MAGAGFTEIAGGFVNGASLANGLYAQGVKGCSVLKNTGGFYTVILQTRVNLARWRVWTQNMAALIPHNIVVSPLSPTGFTIATYRVIFDVTPPGSVALELADYNFAFGVSEVPE